MFNYVHLDLNTDGDCLSVPTHAAINDPNLDIYR